MTLLISAIVLMVALSFLCSLSEALILRTTAADIAALKKKRPRRGAWLERMKIDLEGTVSTLLTLNTLANTLGSILVGGLAIRIYGDAALGLIAGIVTVLMLIFAEIFPKTIGASYRRELQPHLVYPLGIACRLLRPITAVSGALVRVFVNPPKDEEDPDQEIILLAERGAQQGKLTRSESSIITNALALHEVRVSEMMTPRTVVTALRKSATVQDVFIEYPNLPFGRLPVYGRNLDDVVGLVRRRDLLKAKANDQDTLTVESLMQEVHFIPETVTAENALQVFLKHHQHFLVVVDEFGATSGVLTMEDVIEQILGREIFDKDDVAVDMRELARSKLQRQSAQLVTRRAGAASIPRFTHPPK